MRWQIQTPTGTPGPVAVVQLVGESAAEIDASLARIEVGPVSVGAVVLRDLCGVDRGLVARWSETSVHLMPHGGAAVVKGLCAALVRAGVKEGVEADPGAVYPEAASEIEARMLSALARAASPLAIDVLLSQSAKWEAGRAVIDNAQARRLSYLIDPALVVAIGPPNVGKSSLVNALAGRRVSIVADEPGTTRDHVGVMIDMAGLVVRYIDTPGVRADGGPIERDAQRLAIEVAAKADLVLRCGDVTAAPVVGPGGIESVVVATRTDLGLPSWAHEATVSVKAGQGVQELAGLIRELLVPQTALEDPGAWQFWA